MSEPIPTVRRVELEPPSRWRTFRSVNTNRARIVMDRLLHRPPRSRRLEPDFRAGARRALGLSESTFEALWDEAANSGLESRISAQLRERFPQGPPVQLIAAPEGDWLQILRFLYVLVRATKPEQAVETGVGPVGASTTFILGAMHANQQGHLWSIDAGYYISVHGVEPGSGIPEDLRDRHTLLIAEARSQLPRLAAQCAPLGLFLHDSEHTYANMTFEFSVAWTRLAPSGFLLADDAHNDSPDRFANRVGVTPTFLQYGGSPFGVLRKP